MIAYRCSACKRQLAAPLVWCCHSNGFRAPVERIKVFTAEEIHERLQKLPTFEPEYDTSDHQEFALGNDPIEMEEQEPDWPGDWLRRSDVLAAFPTETQEER